MRKNGTIDSHIEELAIYLAQARGPAPTTMDFFHMRSSPRGEAARVVFKEYDVPVDTSEPQDYVYNPNDGRNWSYGTPSKFFGHVGMHDAQADFYGNVWFTHADSSWTLTISHINEKIGAFTGFKFDEPQGFPSQSHGNGFADNYARIDINTKSCRFVPTQNLISLQPYVVTLDTHHRVWTNFWSTDAIGRYDDKSKT